MVRSWRLLVFTPILGLFVVAIGGCNNAATTSANTAAPKPTVKAAAKSGKPTANHNDHPVNEHDHKPSTHGGLIVSVGNDRYHAEAVFEVGGTLRLYILGQDETTVQEIDEQTLEGHIKRSGSSLWVPLILKPTPQLGDMKGKTSQFTGRVPSEFVGQRVIVKFPAIRIGQERFRIAFESGSQDEAEPHREEHTTMPAKVTLSEEQKLYLTPGGKYTEADIKANGNLVASEKFKGLRANHDLKPKVGDKICPITLTLANPQFSWVIDGETYQFCCPPCVDEFVVLSKEKPNEIRPPEFYTQK